MLPRSHWSHPVCLLCLLSLILPVSSAGRSPAVGSLLCRRPQHTAVRALLFSGIDFESETKTIFASMKVAVIDPNPCLVDPKQLLESSQGSTNSKTRLHFGLGAIYPGAPVCGGRGAVGGTSFGFGRAAGGCFFDVKRWLLPPWDPVNECEFRGEIFISVSSLKKITYQNLPKSPHPLIFRPTYRWCAANFSYFSLGFQGKVYPS